MHSMYDENLVWQAAIDFGIDVSLLIANLRLTPVERIANLVAANKLQHEIQSRTLTEPMRRRIERQELAEKLRALEQAQ